MILIAGSIDVDPARREAALQDALPLLAPTRAQAGCVAYSWSADPELAGRLHVFEVWADESALAAHFAGACYAGMRAVLGRAGLRGGEIAKYRCDLRGPVYDAEGRARADFFTPGT